MADPLLEQMTRLRLKLLDKRLRNQRDHIERRAETPLSARSLDEHEDKLLYDALRRKNDLLQKLKEQHLLEELSRPHTWGEASRWLRRPPLPAHFYQHSPVTPPLPPAPHPQPPRIVQTMPPEPTTIIQQLPQQQPLVAQVLPPQAFLHNKPRSIKEDMVELMLLQNAQMHQIIMHSMMLKATPPTAFPPAGGASQGSLALQYAAHPGQDGYQGSPVFIRTDKPRGSSVHHHHHYSTTAAAQLPLIGYSTWPSAIPSVRQEGASLQTKSPVAFPPLHI